MALGVAFQLKVMLTVSLFCVAAAIPDMVTGILVRRCDPDPAHGKALMYFFMASGLLRTASLGVVVFLVCILTFLLLPMVGGLADVGAVAGLLVTMGVFVVVFPITCLGVMHGLKVPGGVFFCRDLTRIRRRPAGTVSDRAGHWNPTHSLRILAAGSAISAAVFSMSTVFLAAAMSLPGKPVNGVVQVIMISILLAQLVIPVVWYIFFCVRFVEPWQDGPHNEAVALAPPPPDDLQFLGEVS